MSKKLQNIKAVQEMIDGTHKFQTKKTTAFGDAKSNESRLIGSVWEETDPVSGLTYVVEQHDGFRTKKPKNSSELQEVRDAVRSFPNCRKDTCTCVGTHPIDKKMQKIHGMCFDCTVDMEHELKKSGKYEEYEQQKIRENALAWLESAERDVAMLKQTYTAAAEFVTNSEGQIESWTAKMTPEEFEDTIQKQFNQFKENFLTKLNGKTNENN